MTIRQSIPFNPRSMSWDEWNGGLIHYFGEEPIPFTTEEDWATLANSLILLPTFATYGAPEINQFSDWREWASAFVEAVNGPTSQGHIVHIIALVDIEK